MDMRKIKFQTVILLATVSLPTSLFASDVNEKIEVYHQYLKDNVIGRRTVLQSDPCTGTIPGTDIRCTFSSTVIRTNLVRTPLGLTFQEQASIKQTNFIPQGDGSVRSENKDRDFVYNCEYRHLRAPDAPEAMLGYCRFVYSASSSDLTGSYYPDKLQLVDGNLVITSEPRLFDAFFNNGVGYRLAETEAAATFKLVDGKLEIERKSQIYHFNDNGERFPAGESETYLYKQL